MRERDRHAARERLDRMYDQWLAQDAHGKTRQIAGRKPREDPHAPQYELEELNDHRTFLAAVRDGKNPAQAAKEAKRAREKRRMDLWWGQAQPIRIKSGLLGPDGHPLAREEEDGEESAGGS